VPSETVSTDVILETEGLTKEFRGFVAVNNVSLRVRRGSIHALIGPNGAGKTTCFNLLTHFLTPTVGRIRFNGRDITGSKPAAIARMGLVRSFQISAVFPHLSVLENVRIALQRRRGASFDFWRSERVLDALNGRAVELIDAVGLAEFAATLAVELPYGRKRALEIATTLALDPEMMLLDEPTAGMTHEDDELIARPSNHIAWLGIAFCPEERGIFASLNVEENLMLPPAVRPGGLSVEAIHTLFPNLRERRRSQGTKLSGGEQQMLAIARILRTGARL